MSASDVRDALLATGLLPHHAELVARSGISLDVAKARGYRSVSTKVELRRLGFSERQARTPALLLPARTVHGEIGSYQIRPDEPAVDKRGRVRKYETPAGSRMILDVPPGVRDLVRGPVGPLFVTEGIRKGDAAASRGLAVVALLGVWNWRGRNELDGLTSLGDWECVCLKDGHGNARRVYLAFDSDLMTKPAVHAALRRLKAFLESRGAEVWVVYLPPGPDGAKTGLDDFLAAGRTPEELVALAEPGLRALAPETEHFDQYAVIGDRTYLVVDREDGPEYRLVANFSARILADIEEDDGLEPRRLFEVEARLDGDAHILRVPAATFGAMNWPLDRLGARAVVFPGYSLKDHLRVATLLRSKDCEHRVVYTHTGWRTVRGEEVFLHAGGAIGRDGVRDDIDVSLPPALQGYALPSPPDGERCRAVVRGTLAVLRLAPARIMVPSLGVLFRSLFGETDCGVHLEGETGTRKSELASIVARHMGPSMDRLHLPVSWSATENTLEDLAFSAKDVLLVVDDFARSGGGLTRERLQAKAERLFRAQGNRSARQRMRADGSLRPPRPPRGSILSTGEESPAGQSIRARLLIVQVREGDVDVAALTECQALAASGLYAEAIAAFIQWLAARVAELRQECRRETVRLRALAARSGQHARTPEIVANLAAGWEIFLAFAREIGAIDEQAQRELADRVWAALADAATAQSAYQAAAEPTQRFLDLLAAALSSGGAHVANSSGGAPPTPEGWGWRESARPDKWEPQGGRIGWVEGDELFLNPDAAYAVAQRLATTQDDPLSVDLDRLLRSLDERGLIIAAAEGTERRLRARKVLEGRRRRVVHLRATSLFPCEEPGQPGHEGRSDPEVGGSEASNGAAPARQEDRESGAPGHVPGHGTPVAAWALIGVPPRGPDGPAPTWEGRPGGPGPAESVLASGHGVSAWPPATGPRYATTDPEVFREDDRCDGGAPLLEGGEA